MIRIALAAVLLFAAVAAQAQSQLDRLESVSEQMNLEMAKMMAREIAANGGDPAPMLAALPDTSWDDAFRAAGTCMLDQYTAMGGPGAVDTLLDRMEAVIPQLQTATMTSLDSLDLQPEGITQEQSAQIAQSCGFMQLSMARMQESGFTAAMMQAFQQTQGN